MSVMAFLTLFASAFALCIAALAIKTADKIRALYQAHTVYVDSHLKDLLAVAQDHSKRLERMGNSHGQLAGTVRQLSDLLYEPEEISR